MILIGLPLMNIWIFYKIYLKIFKYFNDQKLINFYFNAILLCYAIHIIYYKLKACI